MERERLCLKASLYSIQAINDRAKWRQWHMKLKPHCKRLVEILMKTTNKKTELVREVVLAERSRKGVGRSLNSSQK
jgi:hypothetical protein